MVTMDTETSIVIVIMTIITAMVVMHHHPGTVHMAVLMAVHMDTQLTQAPEQEVGHHQGRQLISCC